MKSHLRMKGRSACGYEGERTTPNPAEVDCLDCQRTIHMADRELELINASRRVYR